MKYIVANDQEDIWATRQTMAFHPELPPLCRLFWRLPCYGSLWHPGRGCWNPLRSRPINGSYISSILRFLRAGTRSEVMYWSSLSLYGEEEKAGFLKHLAIEKASNMMSVAAGMGDKSNWGSDSDSSKGILDSVLKPALGFIGSVLNWSKEVHPMLGMDIFMECLQTKAKETDLSKELHLLARIEQALSKMHNEVSAMLFIVRSSASLIYRRPSIEMTGLLSELVQLVLQRAERRTSVIRLPYVYIGEMCNEGFFKRILSNLLEGVAIHFIIETGISLRQKMGDLKARRQVCLEDISTIFFDTLLKDMLFRRLDGEGAAKAAVDSERNEFLERAELKPPQVLRMIDCIATRDEGRVVLMDWKDCVQEWGYSAISHTYGQDVYQVFNCTCASICRAATKPRCSFDTCPHDPAALNAAHTTQTRVVKEILNMCGTLCDAGVHYAWHDGVCIAQHDEDEVRETIQHIGWVYSSGRETIIFLHYVGKPMAPIKVSVEDPVCRWHTRVWTFQEAALSKHRRYCIRMGKKAVCRCESLVEFIRDVGLWYKDESSSVEVVEEETFHEILRVLYLNLVVDILPKAALENQSPCITFMLWSWSSSISQLLRAVNATCFRFPTIDDALWQCVERESKHKGDRINSILTLAGVKGFVAPKDSDVEASTLEFFEKQGQKGLARALFSINYGNFRIDSTANESRRHKWLPVLGRMLCYVYKGGEEDGMRLRVLENGRLKVRPGDGDELLCYKVRIVVKPRGLAKFDPRRREEGREVVEGVLQSVITNKLASGPSTHMLDMNLDVQRITLFLPQAPSYAVGLMGTSLTDITGGSARLVDPGDQHLLEEEESFDAHLVTTSRCVSRIILLLHGNDILSGEVSKIGVINTFYPSVFNQFMLTSNIKPEKLIII